MRVRGQPIGQWLGPRALTLATGLGAATPVIVSTARAVGEGWVPIADRAIIATRAHDVFTDHAPSVGQYTLAGEVTGHVVRGLGPMLFWLLALPSRVGSPTSLTLTMGALNTACILGCVALARRRGGWVLMFMSAIAILLMSGSLAAETFHDVWNPSAALFPFTLLIFLCWGVACGEYRLLALAVLFASFVVQAHLSYLAPALCLLVVAVGGLGGRAFSRPPGLVSGPSQPAQKPIERRSLLIWVSLAAVIGAICWSAPLVDQLGEPHGNLGRVIETASAEKHTLGARVGWHAVVRAVGIAPWWLTHPNSRWQRKREVRLPPSALATWSCAAMLCALIALVLVALRRRRADVASLAVISLLLCLALASVAAATPSPRVLSATLGYTMWWGSQVGMCVWLTLLWSAWLWLAPALGRLSARARPVAAIVGLSWTLAVGGALAASERPDEHVAIYSPVRMLASRLDALIPSGQTILLRGKLDIATMSIKPAIRYMLVERDVRPLAPGSFLRLGSWYELYGRRYQQAVYLSDGPTPPAKGVRLVAQASFMESSRGHTVYAWLSTTPGR